MVGIHKGSALSSFECHLILLFRVERNTAGQASSGTPLTTFYLILIGGLGFAAQLSNGELC